MDYFNTFPYRVQDWNFKKKANSATPFQLESLMYVLCVIVSTYTLLESAAHVSFMIELQKNSTNQYEHDMTEQPLVSSTVTVKN